MAKLVWRMMLVAELEPGAASETEVARIEREGACKPVGFVPNSVGFELTGRG
jgi:hypothetical protein